MIPLGLKVAGANGYEDGLTDLSDTEGRVSISAGGTPEVGGAWYEMITSADFDATMVRCLQVAPNNVAFRLGVGGSGSEVAITKWYRVSSFANFVCPWVINIPINIAKGDRVSMQSIANTTFQQTRVYDIGISNVANYPTLQCEDFGSSSNHSSYLTLDAGATVNTKSAYTEITSSCALNIKRIDLLLGATQMDNVEVYFYIDIAIGSAGSEVDIIKNMQILGQQYSFAAGGVYSFDVNIPEGTRISARIQSSTNGAVERAINCVVNGWGN